MAFRFIAVMNEHPGHDTIATFRRRFLKDIEALFVRVLEDAISSRAPIGKPRPALPDLCPGHPR